MRRHYIFIVLVFVYCSSLFAQGFLRRVDKKIVNDQGEIQLRGMGLGGWMLQEGYMLQTSDFANSQHEIQAKIEALIGVNETKAFYNAWLENQCRKVDIDSLASWGFNSIRLPMHYNLFTLPIQEEPIKGQNTWLQKGFELTDRLLDWCKANRIYLILDLHAAPGGQGKDAAISDHDNTKPSLWESAENRSKTIALWRRIAERYANETWIGGYDLINETNWELPGNNMLKSLYVDITNAIRQVDKNHLIIIEGNWWANDFTGLTPPWDTNMAYSFHKYWSTNDKASIQWMLDIRNRHNIPIWCGEAGENSNVWFNDAIRLLEGNEIGWAWWPLKKVESISCPLSIPKPPGYQRLLDYWKGTGIIPSVAEAKNTLLALTESLKLENCTFQKDVIDAMFRQVQTIQVKAFQPHPVPGRVFASDYDLGRYQTAYFDTDVANYQVSTGKWTGWNIGWAYRNDGVDIESCSDREVSNGYNVGWNEMGEWLSYSIMVEKSGTYEIQYRVAAQSPGGEIDLILMDSADGTLLHTVNLPATGGWQSWQTISASAALSRGDARLMLKIRKGGFNLNWMQFNLVSSTEDDEEPAFRLFQNYPNPFNSQTNVEFILDHAGLVQVEVLNLLGEPVAMLHRGLTQAGKHKAVWKRSDSAGRQVPSGLYIIRMTANGFSQSQKMLLLH